MTPTQFYALQGLLVLALCIVIWAKNRKPVEEIPPVEESPTMPKSLTDRLAARGREVDELRHAQEEEPALGPVRLAFFWLAGRWDAMTMKLEHRKARRAKAWRGR